MSESDRDAKHRVLAVRELRVPYHQDWVEASDPFFMRRVVLVDVAVGDYAVYEGIGPVEWVRDFGNKLPFELAVAWYPGLERGKYRE